MQPDLFAGAPRPRKAVNVPRTSVAAYRERPRDQRVADVMEFLFRAAKFDGRTPLTSAELCEWAYGVTQVTTDCLLYVRRGLSDALRLGLVEHAGTRTCGVSGRACVTWAVVKR